MLIASSEIQITNFRLSVVLLSLLFFMGFGLRYTDLCKGSIHLQFFLERIKLVLRNFQWLNFPVNFDFN